MSKKKASLKNRKVVAITVLESWKLKDNDAIEMETELFVKE